MRVLITGPTGYLGSRVVRRLSAAGHDVIAALKSDEARQRLTSRTAAKAIVAPLERPDALVSAVADVDAVVHTAFGHGGDFGEQVAIEERAVAALSAAMSGTEKAFVVTTATGVLGDTGLAPVDDAFAGDPEFPAAIRRGIERIVLTASSEGKLRGVVIRPAILVHGHGASVLPPILVAAARTAGNAGYIGSGASRTSAVHIDDLADLYLLALERAPAGAVYNTAEAAPAATAREVAGAVARGIGAGCWAESVDAEEATRRWGAFPAFLLGMTNQVTAARARDELGWQPGRRTPSLLDDLARGSYATTAVSEGAPTS